MHLATAQLAVTVDSMKNIAIVVLVVMLAIAVLMAKFVKSVTSKAIGILIVGGLMVGVWSERQNLQDCADKVRANVLKGPTKCDFFGTEVEIPGRT